VEALPGQEANLCPQSRAIGKVSWKHLQQLQQWNYTGYSDLGEHLVSLPDSIFISELCLLPLGAFSLLPVTGTPLP